MGTTTNLIQGSAVLYYGDEGATEPSDDDLHNAPASADWTDVGFTKDGVSLTISQEYSELEVDQLIDIPARRLTGRSITVSTNLAEATLENLELALNGGTLTKDATAAGVGVSGTDTFEPDTETDPTYKALILDGLAPSGLVRRVIVRKVLSVSEIEAAYQKDGQTVYAVEFEAHYVSSSVKPFKVIDQTAEPTS